jgi:hypothetical protein
MVSECFVGLIGRLAAGAGAPALARIDRHLTARKSRTHRCMNANLGGLIIRLGPAACQSFD